MIILDMLALKASESTSEYKSRVASIVQPIWHICFHWSLQQRPFNQYGTSSAATSLDITTISTIPKHWGNDISVTRVSTMFSTRVKINAVALAQHCSPEQTKLR